MNYGYPPAGPSRPPQQSSSVLTKIAIAFAGLMVIMVVVTVVSVGSCLGRNDAEGGARLSNEIPAAVLTRLAQSGTIAADEEVLAYYDATIAIDGSDVAVLTKGRIVTAKNGRVTAIALKDVKRVLHRDEALIGDIIEISAGGGKAMKIEIAPLNGGATFFQALTDAVAEAGGSTG